MAYDGSGNFTRLYSWTTDRNGGVKIQATRMDGEDDGFALAFNQVHLRNGVAPATGDWKMGTHKITGLGNPTLAGDALAFNGPAGTPSSLTLTSATGLPLTTGVTGTLPVANGGTGNTTNTSASCSGNSATASVAASCSGNSATATVAASCSGNSATASSVADGSVTPAKLSTGHMNWIAGGDHEIPGNLTVDAGLHVAGGAQIDANLTVSGSETITGDLTVIHQDAFVGPGALVRSTATDTYIYFDRVGGSYYRLNFATSKLTLVINGAAVWSCDGAGAMRTAGLYTPSTTP